MPRMRIAALLLLLAAPLGAKGEKQRLENAALLGVVTVPHGTKLVVAHVLAGSPAEKAGLRAGDRIDSVAGAKMWRPADLDAALHKVAAGKTVNVGYEREDGRTDVPVPLAARASYEGDFLKPVPKGVTGIEAPEWFGHSWGNLAPGAQPPTKENTKGKVVVIHAFQCSTPDCRYKGFPVHGKLEAELGGGGDVVFFHLQTVYEEEERNTPKKGHEMAQANGIRSPVGQDAHVDGAARSSFMTRCGIGGVPWTIVIGKDGKVAWSGETPELPDELSKRIRGLK
jgi:membrane-associated protease RseP (regulator of RpoE activity)